MVQALVIDESLAQGKGGQFSGMAWQGIRLLSGRLKNDVLLECCLSAASFLPPAVVVSLLEVSDSCCQVWEGH